MKWNHPLKTIKTDIETPIRNTGLLALAAFAIATLALLIAIGKD